MKNFFLFNCLWLFCTLFLQATTYYVAPLGNDVTGTGSITQPFATLPRAIEAANPGDIIELRNGMYISNEIRINKNNLTIRSYPGEYASLIAVTDNEDVASCLWYNDPETTGGTLEHLEITGGYYYGIKFESNWDWDNSVPYANRRGVSNITVRNCHIHHTGRDGIKLTPACNNITIENCQISYTGVGPGAAADYNAEGIDNVNANNMVVQNCYIHHTATTGIYVKGGGRNCIIENNAIEDAGEGGIYLGFYTDAEWFDADFNPNYYENINGTVKNNYIINTQHAGIGLFGAKDAKVWNNTVINAALIDVYAALMIAPSDVWVSDTYTATPPNYNVSIQNNIFTQSASAQMPMVRVREGALSGTIAWTNNLYFKNGGAAVFLDDNLTWENLTFEQWQAQTLRDNNSMEADPLFDSVWHIQNGSPCIDAGIPIPEVAIDWEGQPRTTIPDIGADEYGTSTIISNTAATTATNLTAYPNPFTQTATVNFTLPETTEAELKLYGIEGREVAQLFSGRAEAGQLYSVEFYGSGLAAGIYIVSLTSQTGVQQRYRLVLTD